MRKLFSMGLLAAAFAAPAQAADTPQTTPATVQPAKPAAAGGLNLGKHDSNAPINVTSDYFNGNFETKVGTYTGNVVVTQADYKLRADTVKVNIVQGKPSRFEGTGHVVFISTSGTATGDYGTYDLGPPRIITMTGNVVLTKEKDVMRGSLLVINADTNQARLTAKGMPGDRVQSLFIPAQHPPASGDKKSNTESGQ